MDERPGGAAGAEESRGSDGPGEDGSGEDGAGEDGSGDEGSGDEGVGDAGSGGGGACEDNAGSGGDDSGDSGSGGDGGTGDGDMFVKFGAVPTTSVYDCRPYLSGNAETCNIAAKTTTGRFNVMLRAYSAYSSVSLKGSYTP